MSYSVIPAHELIANVAEGLKDEKKRGVTLVSLGIPSIDELLDGGIKIGYESIGIGAYAKTGKTTLLIHIATSLAQRNQKVLWVGLEENEYQTGQRLVARGYNEEEVEIYVDRNKMRKVELEDYDFVAIDAIAKYAKERICFLIV